MMQITDEELTQLIWESDREHLVQCNFGPDGGALDDSPASDWAKRRVEEIRANNITQSPHSLYEIKISNKILPLDNDWLCFSFLFTNWPSKVHLIKAIERECCPAPKNVMGDFIKEALENINSSTIWPEQKPNLTGFGFSCGPTYIAIEEQKLWANGAYGNFVEWCKP